MDSKYFSKQDVIQSKQNDQLFSRLKFSSLGSALVALVMVFIIGPKTNQNFSTWTWFMAIFLVSFYRWISANIYNQLSEEEKFEAGLSRTETQGQSHTGMLVSSMILTHFVGHLKLSKFIPDEFVTVFLPQTVNTEPWSHLPGEGKLCKKKARRQKKSTGP